MKGKEYWKQKDGKLISVDDMDINHLRNVLKMILRNSRKRAASQSFELNGEQAQAFNDENQENEWDDNHEDDRYNIY